MANTGQEDGMQIRADIVDDVLEGKGQQHS